VDWVPIDHLAAVLVELALAPKQDPPGAYGAAINHVVHPHPVTWTSILPLINKTIEESGFAKEPI
jgi:hypothetical protein